MIPLPSTHFFQIFTLHFMFKIIEFEEFSRSESEILKEQIFGVKIQAKNSIQSNLHCTRNFFNK